MSDTSNQGYAGQRDWTSGTSRYNMMEFIFRVLAGGMATATLVQVINVHPGDGLMQGTVDVQLLVNQQDALGNATEHSIVYGLPYSRVAAGTGAVILDPVGKSDGYAGDIGVAVFSSRDISAVKANKAQANPGSFRRFDYADGIYLFSALGLVQPTDYVQILAGGGINTVDRFGNSIKTSSTGIDLVDGNGNSISMASGGVTINGILIPTSGISFDLKTHTHNQPNDSHGDTEAPTNAPNSGS